MTFKMMKKAPKKKDFVLPNNILSEMTSSVLVGSPDVKKSDPTSPPPIVSVGDLKSGPLSVPLSPKSL